MQNARLSQNFSKCKCAKLFCSISLADVGYFGSFAWFKFLTYFSPGRCAIRKNMANTLNFDRAQYEFPQSF